MRVCLTKPEPTEYMYVHLTPKSKNGKTGPIPVTTSDALTCPPSCAVRDGCYAKGFHLGMHWGKVTSGERGTDWNGLLAKIRGIKPGQLWRHNQAGDLPGDGDAIDRDMLEGLTAANYGRRGYTYTHKPVIGMGRTEQSNRWAIRAALAGGFAVNLSGNDLSHADKLASLDLAPVVVILPEHSPETVHTPAGRKVIVCPAQSRQGITCATCQLCAVRTRSVIVGFRAHGQARKQVERVAAGGAA